jgi:uncharacterized membrane protein YgdD (TMEM256/DUF423 family)
MSGWTWLRIAAILGFLSVALGAFGAHALRDRFKVEENDSFSVRANKERMLENFDTGARYQMYHALAMGVVALLAIHGKTGGAISVAGWAFLVGTILFSGSLYVLVLTGQRWLGAVTPFGGVGFLIGWLALAVAASSGSGRP